MKPQDSFPAREPQSSPPALTPPKACKSVAVNPLLRWMAAESLCTSAMLEGLADDLCEAAGGRCRPRKDLRGFTGGGCIRPPGVLAAREFGLRRLIVLLLSSEPLSEFESRRRLRAFPPGHGTDPLLSSLSSLSKEEITSDGPDSVEGGGVSGVFVQCWNKKLS